MSEYVRDRALNPPEPPTARIEYEYEDRGTEGKPCVPRRVLNETAEYTEEEWARISARLK